MQNGKRKNKQKQIGKKKIFGPLSNMSILIFLGLHHPLATLPSADKKVGCRNSHDIQP